MSQSSFQSSSSCKSKSKKTNHPKTKEYQFKKDSSCREHEDNICYVQEESTVNDDIQDLRCTLCCFDWKESDIKWVCTRKLCHNLFCYDCVRRDRLESTKKASSTDDESSSSEFELSQDTKPSAFRSLTRSKKTSLSSRRIRTISNDVDSDESNNDNHNNSNNKKRHVQLETDRSALPSEQPPRKNRKLNTSQKSNKGMELFKQIMKERKDHIASSNRLCALYRTKMETMEKHYLKQEEKLKEVGKELIKQRNQAIRERNRYKALLRRFMDLENNESKEDLNESASIIDENNTNNVNHNQNKENDTSEHVQTNMNAMPGNVIGNNEYHEENNAEDMEEEDDDLDVMNGMTVHSNENTDNRPLQRKKKNH